MKVKFLVLILRNAAKTSLEMDPGRSYGLVFGRRERGRMIFTPEFLLVE